VPAAPSASVVPPAGSAPAYPPRLLRYVAAVVAAAVPTAIAALTMVANQSPGRNVLLGAGACTVAALAAELKPVPLDESGTRIVSLAFVFIMACQILYGWEYAAVAALVSTVLVQTVERAPAVKATFNAAVWVLAALASGLPAAVLGWNTGHVAPTDAVRLTVLAVAGGLAYITVNVALVSGAIALQLQMPLRRVLDDYLHEAGPAFAVMALVAALAASLWKLSPGLEPLLAGPLFALALSQRYARRSTLAVRASETDGLTGLGNHRSFHTTLTEVLESAAAGSQPATLCLLDLDDFKSVNDRFGHPAGDRLLTAVADLLREEFDGPLTFRIGGEEFAVLLPEASADTAYNAIERLHHRLLRTALPHGEPITISAGIASFPDSAGDRDELLRSTGPSTTARTAPASTARAPSGSTHRRSWRAPPSGSRGCVQPRAWCVWSTPRTRMPALTPSRSPSSWRGSPARWAWATRWSTTCGWPDCCTTSARSRSPIGSCRSPGHWTARRCA